jgi:hypothetical protein
MSERASRIDAAEPPFLADAWLRLSSPADCASTDVAGAVDRALLFLAEPADWTVDPRKAVVLVSDAQHNTSRWDVTLPDDVDVLVANGIGSRGALSAVADLKRFESLTAAIGFHRRSRQP